MTDMVQISALVPLFPELFLATGALVLLLIGAIGGQGVWRATMVAVASPHRRDWCLHRLCATGDDDRVWRQLRDRRIFPLHEATDADRLGRSNSFVAGVPAHDRARQFRIPDPHPARDDGHDDHDFVWRPDRALPRPRTDEPVALCAGVGRPRQRALDRSRPEVLCPRRALVRHAALRRVADLRLHRHHQLRRHRQGRGRGWAWRHIRIGVPACRSLLQGVGGTVPHVDARRLRRRADAGHGVLCLRAEDRRDGVVRARRHRRRSQPSRCSGSKSWYSCRSRRWCSAPLPRSDRPTSSG